MTEVEEMTIKQAMAALDRLEFDGVLDPVPVLIAALAIEIINSSASKHHPPGELARQRAKLLASKEAHAAAQNLLKFVYENYVGVPRE